MKHSGPGAKKQWLCAYFPELQSADGNAHDPLRRRHALRQLAQEAYQYVSQIALAPPCSLVFEVASLKRLYPSLQDLVAQLRACFQDYRVHFASGLSPLSARLLAYQWPVFISDNTAELERAMGELSVHHAGIPAAQVRQLEGVGVFFLKDLLELPTAAVVQRFGKPMSRYLAEVKGHYQSPQSYYQAPPYFYQRLDLQMEVSHWKPLLFPLQRMLRSLEEYLQTRQLATTALLFEAHHRDGSRTPIQVRFTSEVWRTYEMQPLCSLSMERSPLPLPALEISLRVEQLHSRKALASDLLSTSSSHWSMPELLSRLRIRLGDDAVYGATATAEQRPERAWRRVASAQRGLAVMHKPRPLWLLPEPQPINRAHWQLHWGPERLVTGWWDQHPIKRDYYIAIDLSGRQGWVFHTPPDWYVHGWFG